LKKCNSNIEFLNGVLVDHFDPQMKKNDDIIGKIEKKIDVFESSVKTIENSTQLLFEEIKDKIE
jgi:hypothetical protein